MRSHINITHDTTAEIKAHTLHLYGLPYEPDQLWEALAAMVLTPHIRQYLKMYDPQALKQARLALGLKP